MTRPHGNSVALLRPLATLLGRLGEDEHRFLLQLGVSDETPADAYVPDVIVDRALDAIAAARGDETFGLSLAREAVARRPLGLFGNLVWLSGTLRDALTRAAHFYSLVTRRGTLVVDDGDGEGSATVTRYLFAGAARGKILAEYMFGSLVLRAREAAGSAFTVRAMQFAHRARSAAPYEELFQAPVSFQEGADAVEELTLDARLLALPLPSADPFTVAAIEAHVQQLDIRGDATPLGDRVRHAIEADLRTADASAGNRAKEPPSLERVARRMGIGARSLRRQLQEERVAFRTVVTAARTDRARELLRGGASIKTVAFTLGFSEPSAFSRAYKRWTGRPPSGQ